ncbi:MAG: hypothetical protein QOD69_1651 [Solirubrobacteraceae bacterium]|nr:hypothetical protein [Solirubrobacteraceae bacterium]
MSHVEPGAVAGHGTIRLRGQLPPTEAPATTVPEPAPAAAAGPVGHGAIRLRRAEAARVSPAPEPGSAGHGTVVLYGTTSAAQARFATPVVTDDRATASAREDILAALDAGG